MTILIIYISALINIASSHVNMISIVNESDTLLFSNSTKYIGIAAYRISEYDPKIFYEHVTYKIGIEQDDKSTIFSREFKIINNVNTWQLFTTNDTQDLMRINDDDFKVTKAKFVLHVIPPILYTKYVFLIDPDWYLNYKKWRNQFNKIPIQFAVYELDKPYLKKIQLNDLPGHLSHKNFKKYCTNITDNTNLGVSCPSYNNKNYKCLHWRRNDNVGTKCKSILNSFEMDNSIADFCSEHKNNPDCACVSRFENDDYKNLYKYFIGIDDLFWYKPCSNRDRLMYSRDLNKTINIEKFTICNVIYNLESKELNLKNLINSQHCDNYKPPDVPNKSLSNAFVISFIIICLIVVFYIKY